MFLFKQKTISIKCIINLLFYSIIIIFNKKRTDFLSVTCLQMAEEEGFEPPRLLHPFGFQDRPLQPGLGIPPNK